MTLPQSSRSVARLVTSSRLQREFAAPVVRLAALVPTY